MDEDITLELDTPPDIALEMEAQPDIIMEIYPVMPADAPVDKYYVHPFTNLSEVTVPHNLNKRPSISVENSAGDEVEGEVKYVDPNTMIVRFSSSFTGRIICN